MKHFLAACLLLSLKIYGQAVYEGLSSQYTVIEDFIPSSTLTNQAVDMEILDDNVYVLVCVNTQLAVYSYTKDGKVNSDFASSGHFEKTYGYALLEPRMAIDQNGNIYIGTYNGVVVEVVKINQQGVQSTAFGGTGIFTFSTTASGYLTDMIWYNNTVVLTGYNGLAIFAMKLNASGQMETSFDGDGYAALTYVNDTPYIYGMTVDTETGNIYLVGYIYYFVSSSSVPVIVRFNTAGVDTNFGTGGVVNVSSTATFRGVKIIGEYLYICGYKLSGSSQGLLTKFSKAGVLDTNFGTSGEALIGHVSHYEYFHQVAEAPDGNILAAGYRMSMPTYNNDNYFAKFTTGGSVVTDFGTGGELVDTSVLYQRTNVLKSDDKQLYAAGYSGTKFMVIITGEDYPIDGVPDFPTGFSPNSDGKNDYLEVRDVQFAKEKKLKVYDREGNLVFQDDDYQNDWQGVNSSSKALSDGVYYYVFKYGPGKDEEVKSYIEIRR